MESVLLMDIYFIYLKLYLITNFNFKNKKCVKIYYIIRSPRPIYCLIWQLLMNYVFLFWLGVWLLDDLNAIICTIWPIITGLDLSPSLLKLGDWTWSLGICCYSPCQTPPQGRVTLPWKGTVCLSNYLRKQCQMTSPFITDILIPMKSIWLGLLQ